jgi:hypothetical protein
MASTRKKSRKYLYLVTALFVIIIVMAILELTNTTHIFHKQNTPVATTGNSLTKGEQSTNKNTTPSTSNATNTNGSKTSTGTASSNQAPLSAPWGTFANVNKATLNETMESSCNTVPGANCQITFTSGNLTESLSTKTSDSGGAVYWSWTPSSIGLSPGTWHEAMKATLGSQSNSASNDPLTLEVTQ